MPWCRTGRAPSLELVEATLALVRAVRPRWWVIENVRGSIRWIRTVLGSPFYGGANGLPVLWGDPPPGLLPVAFTHKTKLSGAQRAERALIPYELGYSLCRNAERVMGVELSSAGQGRRPNGHRRVTVRPGVLRRGWRERAAK